MALSSSHGWAPDHRLIAVWRRASARTERRVLTFAAYLDGTPGDDLDEAVIRRFDRLIGEASRLTKRLEEAS